MEARWPLVELYGAKFNLIRRGRLSMLIAAHWSCEAIERSYRDLSAESRADLLDGGRATVRVIQLDDDHSVACRSYRRGGMVRHLVTESFFTWPPFSLEGTRSFRELEVLCYLLGKAVSVVKPLAAIASFSPTGLVHGAVLMTRYEDQSESLMTVFKSAGGDKIRLRSLALRAGNLAANILRAGVYHPDLHPGNIILCADESLKALDFDKAFIMHESGGHRYRANLVDRWSRSIRKNMLDEKLAEKFAEGINDI